MELCAAAATALQIGCVFRTRNRCRANDGLEGNRCRAAGMYLGHRHVFGRRFGGEEKTCVIRRASLF